MRTKKEVDFLLAKIQDELEDIEIEYKKRRELLFNMAQEIRNEKVKE